VSLRLDAAWRALESVPDPELPTLSIRDLGIVRDVVDRGDAIEVVVTPTYSGCPANEVIEAGVRAAIEGAGLGPAVVVRRLAPAWTTDWIGADGRRKLLEAGIAPPGPARPVVVVPGRASCPRCGSARTERLSEFGATACKSLWRCLDCREPFERFKPL
jgi:ring-1,2-phenylacetyl-CoA epoxidase subunit PaaD